MRRPPLTLERIRPVAGPVLLGVFLLAAEGTPLVHLATHRDDHVHGPETVAAHRHDDDHDHHYDHDDLAPPAGRDHHGDEPTPAAPDRPDDHGRASSAHFDLALLAGPLPPLLAPPSHTITGPRDVVLRRHHAPAQPHPPVRGPPRRR